MLLGTCTALSSTGRSLPRESEEQPKSCSQKLNTTDEFRTTPVGPSSETCQTTSVNTRRRREAWRPGGIRRTGLGIVFPLQTTERATEIGSKRRALTESSCIVHKNSNSRLRDTWSHLLHTSVCKHMERRRSAAVSSEQLSGRSC